jgi:hypothetical protein
VLKQEARFGSNLLSPFCVKGAKGVLGVQPGRGAQTTLRIGAQGLVGCLRCKVEHPASGFRLLALPHHKALGQVPNAEFEVLPPLPLLPLQRWVLLPKGGDLRFHERTEIRVCANPGLQPPHARAPRGAVFGHKGEADPLMVSYEPEDHCCLRDPPLDVGRCQPPVQPRHRLPWSCESEARGLITRVEFPPAVHQAQGVLDGLKTADVADAASLRSNSGLGGNPRWGGGDRQALVPEWVRYAVKISPN